MFEISTYTQSPAQNSLHTCNIQVGNFSFIALSDLIFFFSEKQPVLPTNLSVYNII